VPCYAPRCPVSGRKYISRAGHVRGPFHGPAGPGPAGVSNRVPRVPREVTRLRDFGRAAPEESSFALRRRFPPPPRRERGRGKGKLLGLGQLKPLRAFSLSRHVTVIATRRSRCCRFPFTSPRTVRHYVTGIFRGLS